MVAGALPDRLQRTQLSFDAVRFSVIIITKGRPVPLAAALRSAARALPPDGEVIVVDGDPERSAEPVVAELRGSYPGLDMRYLASDPGAALQRNVGVDAARGDVVVYIDDDCTFEPGLFEALETAYRDPTVVGATGIIDHGPSESRLGSDTHSRWRRLLLGGGRQGTVNGAGFHRPIVDVEQRHDVEFMAGPLMSARRDLAAEVRFDELLAGYALGEDADFSLRLSRRGRICYEPSAKVTCYELGWEQRDQRQVDRVQVISRIYLFRKNFPQTLKARSGFAVMLAVLCLHRVLNREWSGLRGLLEGMRQVRRSGAWPSGTPAQPS
jgi:glycosyltransferase involved in cell wall biosynthesis